MSFGIPAGLTLVILGVAQIVFARGLAAWMRRRDHSDLGEAGTRVRAGHTPALYRFTGAGLVALGVLALVFSLL